MSELARVLEDAGGIAAPRDRIAQIRAELGAALADGARELAQARSGYRTPVPVGIAPTDGVRALTAVAPLAP